jgi:hypothetical protein
LNLKFININAVETTTKFCLEEDGHNTKIMTVRYCRASRDERPGRKLKSEVLERTKKRGFTNQHANHQEQQFQKSFVSKEICNKCN